MKLIQIHMKFTDNMTGDGKKKRNMIRVKQPVQASSNPIVVQVLDLFRLDS